MNREVEQLQERIECLRSRVEKVTSVISDMPKGGGNQTDLKDELIDLIDLLALKQKQCIVEQNRLERYINTINDSQIRTIFSYRFINGMSWRQIAFRMGGGNTEDGVRMTVKRFIKKTA